MCVCVCRVQIQDSGVMLHAVEVADDSEEEFAHKCGALVSVDFPRQMLTNILYLCICLCPIYHTKLITELI